MRFKTGLVVGVAVGYYFGARAGRERYEQIEEYLDRFRATTSFQQARAQLTDTWQQGADLARAAVDDLTASAGEPVDPGELFDDDADGSPGTPGTRLRDALFGDPTTN